MDIGNTWIQAVEDSNSLPPAALKTLANLLGIRVGPIWIEHPSAPSARRLARRERIQWLLRLSRISILLFASRAHC
jgi:hypothetical protein